MDKQLDDATELRKRVEEKAHEKTERLSNDLDALTPEEIQRIVHELQVHQIEREMQNEELRRSQTELDETHAQENRGKN